MNRNIMEIDELATQPVITPEMFANDPSDISMDDINSCIDYAGKNNVTITARGNYQLTESITMDSVKWTGGHFIGNGTIIIINSTIDNVDIDGPNIEMSGGSCTLANNKIHNQTTTAAFLIDNLQSTARLNCTNNEFYDCNYAILQQGSSGLYMDSGVISFNSFHDTAGDAIELNIVNKHYSQGLIIEGNIISNINGHEPDWGIGIGIAGNTPYGIEIPDEYYASNFTIKNNYITGCCQCIHTELCRDFSIINNTCYPDSGKSTGDDITSGAYVSYGCKRFIIDGLNGEPVTPSLRFLVLDWGSNEDSYAGPPTYFTVNNIDTINGNVEITTAGSSDWENTTIIGNIKCNNLYWRGLPSISIFRNIYCSSLDYIGRYSASEGSGGDIYERYSYTCTHWANILCLDMASANVSIEKMYVDKLIATGNNFPVSFMSSESNGNKEPLLAPPTEEYFLPDDNFPAGREFASGCLLWKSGGGYFRVTKAGASITGNELIQPVEAGDNYIQTANYVWEQAEHLKIAGTQIIISGAGDNGTDLCTTITRGTYVYNNKYTLDIEPEIKTTLTSPTSIRAANPVEYDDISPK